MRIERKGQSAFELGVSTIELSSLIAAVRVAVDVLEANEQTPPEAIATLQGLLSDYERAAARIAKQVSE